MLVVACTPLEVEPRAAIVGPERDALDVLTFRLRFAEQQPQLIPMGIRKVRPAKRDPGMRRLERPH